ncbi:hypothetical protein JJB79_16410 [Pantoea eucrina]|uniref:Uncharacterized protein n=1 Tax=Pantoea eucrina TaxID=472693 RepID=A0ABS1Z954_9GAMM|nr:hypothetical protein [Pantoea eucrina]MBM0748975.1 hypothetical protein [Pantoea eucrina]QNH53335.1 hypothetical protein HWI77_19200 [Acinetobacter venetianus]
MTSKSTSPALNQPALIGAIMSEIGNQQPGATISAAQFKAIAKAANKVIDAFKPQVNEQADE